MGKPENNPKTYAYGGIMRACHGSEIYNTPMCEKTALR